MNTLYRNEIASSGSALISHIALYNDLGSEISGGSYARQAVTWTSPSDGVVRPNADLTFSVPSGSTVAEWRGFDASTAGTDFGGASLTNETFSADGEYTLLSGSTAINHASGSV